MTIIFLAWLQVWIGNLPSLCLRHNLGGAIGILLALEANAYVLGVLNAMLASDACALEVYTGNFQGTGIACKHGIKYPKQVSVCLESQKYPDSPNKKDWPQPYLKPGEKYYSHCAYKFSVK